MSENTCIHCKKQKNRCLPCLVPCADSVKSEKPEESGKPSTADHGKCECSNVKPGTNKMPETSRRIDVKSCAKVEPPHHCDTKVSCDPFEEDEGDCPSPFICLERLKNPAFSGEITKCMRGSFIYAKSCAKVEPPHPCDPHPSCSEKKSAMKKKRPCSEPPLCVQRIKNPENKKDNVDSCDPPE